MTDDDKTTQTARIPELSMLQTAPWPTLTEDQKAELRTAAPQLVKASRTASEHAVNVAQLSVSGFWQAAAKSAISSLACLASGVALGGATLAWLACGDGEQASTTKGG